MFKRIFSFCAMTVLAIVFVQLSANTPAQAQTASSDLNRLLDQLRPPEVPACPCNFRSMALWAGWDRPVCVSEVNQAPDGRVLANHSIYSGDDEMPYAELDLNLSGNEIDAVCSTLNDNETPLHREDVDPQELALCAKDLEMLGTTLGLFGGCPSPVDFD